MQRVKVTFDRNQDGITEHYLVYRAMGQAEPVLAHIVAHPLEPNPIYVENEALSRVNNVYYTAHGNIMEGRELVVTMDGERVLPVAVNYREGVITIAPVPPEGSLVAASYWFDGVQYLDTNRPQAGVTPMAPPAIDRSPPLPVQNPRLGLDAATGLVRLEFDLPPATSGTVYRYYVVAADHMGNRSWPSEIARVTLNQSLGEIPFVIQRSDDGGMTWAEIASINETHFLDQPLFTGPMNPVRGLAAEVLPATGGSPGQVVLSWQPPLPGSGMTAMYRIITRSALDAYSDPSYPVGPQPIDRIAVKYIVRRKNPDGSEVNLGETADLSFADTAVEAYQTYVYSVLAADALGIVSEAMTVEVNTGDLMPPEAPAIIDINYS